MAQTEPMRAPNPSARTVRAKCSDELNVSLTSGLPMVRQGLKITMKKARILTNTIRPKKC